MIAIRILFFVDQAPVSLDNGYTLRTYNICKELRKRNHKIYLLYLYENRISIVEELEKDIAEKTFPMHLPFFSRKRGKIYKMLSSYPLESVIFTPTCFKKLQNRVKNIVKLYGIDLVHIQGRQTALFLKDFHELPKLLDLSDCLSLALKRELQVRSSLIDKLKYNCLFNWSKGFEKALLKSADIATVVSSPDKQMLEKLNVGAHIEVVPNGVDSNYFSQKSVTQNHPSIIFHGNMDFSPNVSSVKYISKEIFPLVKSKIPDLKFYVVGKNPNYEVKSLANNKDIIVTGFVEDIREYVSKASLGLYPMLTGSGVKNKILETMAMEKPVVSNPMGVEALNEKAKGCMMIGNTAEEIARQVLSLLKDKRRRVELGKKGRKVVIEEYSWDKVAEEYEKIYNNLLKNK